MTGERQWWIFFAAFIAVSVLLFFVLVSALGQTDRPSVYDTDPSSYDQHLTELDRQALDEAYRKYRTQLFESWMKDPTGMPDRAIFGAEKARTVYLYVQKNLDERFKK